MPMLGLGTWPLRGEEGERLVLSAIAAGYRLFDTAQMYENEEMVGNAIRKSGIARSEFFVTTKLCGTSTDYASAKESIYTSLKRLNTEYIDLLLIHGPYPHSELLYRAMRDVQREGAVRSLGISNFTLAQYKRFSADTGEVPALAQAEIHVYKQREEYCRFLRGSGTAVQAWSPLSSGRSDCLDNCCVKRIAARYGRSAAQIILRFLIQKQTAAVVRSQNTAHIEENIRVFDFELDDADMAELELLNSGKSYFRLDEE